jgi:N-methylhydantoinase A
MMAPRRPGVVSALGGLVADLRGDFVRTVFTSLTADALHTLQVAQDELGHEGRDWLDAQGHHGEVVLSLSADMRYAGQSFEIEVPLDEEWIPSGQLTEVTRAFHEAHDRIYDFHDPDGAIELVNLRLSAIGEGPGMTTQEADEQPAAMAPARQVPVFTGGARTSVGLYQRHTLVPGSTFHGPAVVTQEDTTLVIPAQARARVDRHHNLHLIFGDEADV